MKSTFWKKLTVESAVRGVLLAYAFLLPILYDLSVPEVSGDIRWTATHLVAGLGALALLIQALIQGKKAKPVERMPWIYVFAVGLAFWAAISVIGSIDPYRCILMIKALYGQLLLMVVAAAVWNRNFTRRLMWALALPVAFASILGICQFFALSDTDVMNSLSRNGLGFMQPLYDALGWLTSWAQYICNGWPKSGGFVNQIVGYYQQSAVPGSSFANKNLAGSWTGMMLPLVMWLVVTSKTWRGRSVASILLALGTLFLLYSRARASWVALLASTLFMAGLFIINTPWRRDMLKAFPPRQWVWLLPTVLLVSGYGGALSPVQAHSVGESVIENASKLVNPTFDDVGGRVAYNLNSLAIVRDHWFKGVGIGAFYAIYPAYYNAVIQTPKNSYNVLARPQRSHTDLMEAFDEMGIPGGLFYVMVFGWGLLAAWGLRKQTALSKVGEWPLFAGWSLLTIYINALMDFPMQLPTAPAVCMLLLGGLVWHQRQVFANAGANIKGWLPTFSRLAATRGAVLATIAVMALANAVAIWDSYYYREANQILKLAMVRIFSGVNDDQTLQLVEEANRIYPYDPRIHEHMAVVYANYTGKLPLSLEQRIAKVEWELEEDPWGANHLINLAGLYLQLAEIAQQQGHPEIAVKALARTDVLYHRLLRVADFSHYTYGVGGMLELLSGHPREARPLFERALAIEPSYSPAKQGLARAQAMLSGTAPSPTMATH
jgi:hypothetical protein